MALNFKYKAIKRPDGRNVKSPSIPVTLLGKINQYEVIGLLDSGADLSVIPKDMAELLGIAIENKKVEESRGIGGAVKSVRTTMGLIISDNKNHEKYELNVPVSVILEGDPPPILLGRAGFFDNFVITFDEPNKKVTLKKIESKKYWG